MACFGSRPWIGNEDEDVVVLIFAMRVDAINLRGTEKECAKTRDIHCGERRATYRAHAIGRADPRPTSPKPGGASPGGGSSPSPARDEMRRHSTWMGASRSPDLGYE